MKMLETLEMLESPSPTLKSPRRYSGEDSNSILSNRGCEPQGRLHSQRPSFVRSLDVRLAHVQEYSRPAVRPSHSSCVRLSCVPSFPLFFFFDLSSFPVQPVKPSTHPAFHSISACAHLCFLHESIKRYLRKRRGGLSSPGDEMCGCTAKAPRMVWARSTGDCVATATAMGSAETGRVADEGDGRRRSSYHRILVSWYRRLLRVSIDRRMAVSPYPSTKATIYPSERRSSPYYAQPNPLHYRARDESTERPSTTAPPRLHRHARILHEDPAAPLPKRGRGRKGRRKRRREEIRRNIGTKVE